MTDPKTAPPQEGGYPPIARGFDRTETENHATRGAERRDGPQDPAISENSATEPVAPPARDGEDESSRARKQERIRERAYAHWEREGRPEGRDNVHWQQAEQELDGLAEDGGEGR